MAEHSATEAEAAAVVPAIQGSVAMSAVATRVAETMEEEAKIVRRSPLEKTTETATIRIIICLIIMVARVIIMDIVGVIITIIITISKNLICKKQVGM